MNRSELVERLLLDYADVRPQEMDQVVRLVFGEIAEALSRGERVEFRDFGAFSVRYRKARVGRNPRTGAPVKVPAKHVPYFRAGKALRDMANTKS